MSQKSMKFSAIFLGVALIAMAVVLSLGLVGVQPAQAQVTITSPTVSVADDPMTAGGSTVMTATGFASGERVFLSIGGVRVLNGTANGSGTITGTVTIPNTLGYNAAIAIAAVNNTGTTEATDTAGLDPGLSVSPASGQAGADMTISGWGFTTSEVVTLTFASVPSLTAASCVSGGVTSALGTATATRIGSIRLESSFPAITAGTYYVVAKGASSAQCVQY